MRSQVQPGNKGKTVVIIEYWNLRFFCNLVPGIWDFKFGTESINPSFETPQDQSPFIDQTDRVGG
jgi:hypothetical protein